ncbi:mitochondrial 37S ribosomal protein S19 [Ascobolus immersus RN42]|uniref:Small ribosomal subunit protein uS19m n=1 Tax=Ascobolus immersus RN42 TaxID=1160509 RepID=A0A3N4IG39_ASCIM|nr:mitochondrial 37S ribosomal protein S19 [Ascobolus immersus RN42]
MIPTLRLLSRSVWKGPHVVSLPIRDATPNVPIRTNARSCTILPNFVGLRFHVHNGKDYVEVRVTEDMVGKKLGEFSPTRKRFSYKATKNK